MGDLKITATPTATFALRNGVRCRVWNAVTEGGVACLLYIADLQVLATDDNSEFERALQDANLQPPLAHVFDMRQVF